MKQIQELQSWITSILKHPLLMAGAATALALGLFAAVTDAPAYAGTPSETCANCHVMDSMYENYYRAAHQPWTECADCHLPHENPVTYYFEKGRQGMHDVYVFSTGTTPELIRLNENSKQIVQANCIRCHQEASACKQLRRWEDDGPSRCSHGSQPFGVAVSPGRFCR